METGGQEEGRSQSISPPLFLFEAACLVWLHQLHGCSSCRAAPHWLNLAGGQLARESGKCLLQISPLVCDSEQNGGNVRAGSENK